LFGGFTERTYLQKKRGQGNPLKDQNQTLLKRREGGIPRKKVSK